MLKLFYLWLIKMVSKWHSSESQKNVIYLMSFKNNLQFVEQLADNLPTNRKLIVFYTSAAQGAAPILKRDGIQAIFFRNGLDFVFKWLPLILTGRLIFCDNYFPFLGGLPKSQFNMTVVQLWHADGAVKRFGWEDPRTYRRSRSAQRRFQAVYNNFDDYVVASKAMGKVFALSYHVPFDRMKIWGYPRSDCFLDKTWLKRTRWRIFQAYPKLKNHRIILYAPTYREHVTFRPPSKLGQALTSDHRAKVIVKLHPLLKKHRSEIKSKTDDSQRLCFDKHFSTAEWLTVVDTLVTDYSSVAFDFSLLPNARSLLFFMFDLKQYRSRPGLQPNFMKWLPERPITTTSGLARAIRLDSPTDFTQFNRVWNTYNDGLATPRVLKHYLSVFK